VRWRANWITDEALLRQRFEGFSEGSDIVIVRDLQHLTLRIPARELFDADSAQLKPGIVSALPWSAVAQLLRKRHHIVAQINVYSDRIGLAERQSGLDSNSARCRFWRCCMPRRSARNVSQRRASARARRWPAMTRPKGASRIAASKW
jgi:outer membrane protein OmpA-like peptidoglycan-associated protein